MKLYIVRIIWILTVIGGMGVLPSSAATLKNIRLGNHAQFTRIVLDLEGKPSLISPPTLESPTALTLSLDAKIAAPLSSNKPEGLIKNFHVNKERHVISFQAIAPITIKKSFLMTPASANSSYRYVIDIEKDNSATSSPITAPSPIAQKIEVAPPPPPMPKKTIIIDAGHGGVDCGAIGYSKKTKEKHITLAVARLLAEKLNSTGHYKCVLTREKDHFLKLGKRLKTAHMAKGDLFVSLHADSYHRPDTRGLAIYTLSSVASDREAARLAQKENAADLLDQSTNEADDPEVNHILVDLVKRETMNLSTQLARSLTKNVGRHVLLLRKPHRFADFYVLRSPHIPSVLVELGYISNKEDEKVLTSSYYQEKICEGLLEGINSYFKEHYA